ncbi:MAG: glycerol-3-phosphate 1-O-acyltransferase PlsY [Opitutales bacterium]|nr:glycerol-3-phosphate 1-O-acyltransferase PlsY [Opitutales bacterium]MCH8541312.1 glycerol-3-phosphate 1-O-acyltransferase PlsY [Opitutales bacterium]
MDILLVIVVGYLLGAISFAVIVARAKGVDILREGSGNPGATNVKRIVGKGPGNLVFFLDVFKGFLATVFPLTLVWFMEFDREEALTLLQILGLVAAILGHSYSVFLRFRGGKGVAVAIGGLSALIPMPLLVGLLVWVATFALSRYVSLASILFALSLPVSTWFFHASEDPSLFYLALFIGMLIVFRHHSNIRSLLSGQEHRFGKSKK